MIQKKIQIYGGKHANLENVLLELTDPPKIDYYEEPVVLDGQVGRALIGDREAEVVREDFNKDYIHPTIVGNDHFDWNETDVKTLTEQLNMRKFTRFLVSADGNKPSWSMYLW